MYVVTENVLSFRDGMENEMCSLNKINDLNKRKLYTFVQVALIAAARGKSCDMNHNQLIADEDTYHNIETLS